MFSYFQLYSIEILMIKSLSQWVNALKTKLFQSYFQRNRNILITLEIPEYYPTLLKWPQNGQESTYSQVSYQFGILRTRATRQALRKEAGANKNVQKTDRKINFRILFADSVAGFEDIFGYTCHTEIFWNSKLKYNQPEIHFCHLSAIF